MPTRAGLFIRFAWWKGEPHEALESDRSARAQPLRNVLVQRRLRWKRSPLPSARDPSWTSPEAFGGCKKK